MDTFDFLKDLLMSTETTECLWPTNTPFPADFEDFTPSFQPYLPPIENSSSSNESELSSNEQFCLIDESYFPPENLTPVIVDSNGQVLGFPQTVDSGFSVSLPASTEDPPKESCEESRYDLPDQEVMDHVVPDTTTSIEVAKKPRSNVLRFGIVVLDDGSVNFSCPMCDLTFPEKERLKDHLRSHNNGKNCFCDICGVVLKYYGHLARHMLSHKTVRPFACEVCGKSFKRKEHLELHSVVHSNLKRFTCEKCGKGFKRKDHVKKHEKTHLRKKGKNQVPMVL